MTVGSSPEAYTGDGAEEAPRTSAEFDVSPRPIPLVDPDPASLPTVRPSRSDMKRHLLMLALLAALFLPNLGAFGLWDPWETHYGEVTRNMIESHDWVSPWWGFKSQIGTEATQGKPFFSKPVWLFWAEAASIRTLGFSEFAIRLPVALVALLAAFSLYFALTRIVSARVGVFTGLIVATSPQFFFLARQTQTDMPYVATMTIGLAFLAVAYFGRREEASDRRFLLTLGGVVGLLLLATLPQYGIIATDLDGGPVSSKLPWIARLGLEIRGNGVYHAIGYSLLLALVLGSVGVPLWRQWRAAEGFTDEFKDRWTRRAWLWVFYVMAAQATLAKGLLGFMLPGAILFLFFLLTWQWRGVARSEILRGLAIFICVGFPWYMAMFAEHGMAYYTRFFIHDHFNRIGAGVHQIDSGTFEHFIKWLGIGVFPWAVLAPFAVLSALWMRVRALDREGMARLFFFIWFLLSFSLFTLSATKFHHYIFPALPALGVLIALYLEELRAAPAWMGRLVAISAVALAVAFLWNLDQDPQNLRNLFTYKYDRPMPEHLPIDVDAPIAADDTLVWGESTFYEQTNAVVLNLLNTPALHYDTFLVWFGALVLISLALLGISRLRTPALWATGGCAVLLTLYSLNVYMPMLSPHWSQKYLFDKYYELCTPVPQGAEIEDAYTPLLAHVGLGALTQWLGAQPKRVCEEDIISWLITWRGETYYSNNEIRPIGKEATQFEAYLEDMNRGETFFVLMERGKDTAWGRKLNNTYLKKLQGKPGWEDVEKFEVEKVGNDNRYFILVRATAVKKGA